MHRDRARASTQADGALAVSGVFDAAMAGLARQERLQHGASAGALRFESRRFVAVAVGDGPFRPALGSA